MAFNTYDIHSQRSTDRHQSDQCDSNANSLPAGSAVTLDGVLINNTTNTHKVYVKIYDNSGPTIGRSSADISLQLRVLQSHTPFRLGLPSATSHLRV